MNWALATKNLRRDRRRSLLTALSVLVGVTAILLFLAYIQFIENAMSRLVIYQDGNAHVQIYRQGGPDQLAAFPARYSLNPDDQRRIDAAVAGAARQTSVTVLRHTPQLMGVGMIQHDRDSTPFLARGVDPRADAALRADGGFADRSEDTLPPQSEPILLTRQIAELLGWTADAGRAALAPDDSVQLSAATYQNRFNAIEAVPAGYFTTGIEAIEGQSVKLPLSLLQSLYDTADVSRVVVQLRHRADTEAFATALQAELNGAQAERYVVTRWSSPQVGPLYQSFMGFANTMFMFTGIVLLLITVATMQHTIASNVTDRLKEVGMLRSFGFSRRAVVSMFVRESLLLGSGAAALALLLSHAISASGVFAFETALPRLAMTVPVTLTLPLATSLPVALAAVLAIVAVAWWTARRLLRGATAKPGPQSLARLVAASAACVLAAVLLHPAAHAAAPTGSAPDEATMKDWLTRADLSRGGFAGYSWTARVRSVEPAGNSDTTYRVAVSDGRALVRTVAPARQVGEKILLDGRAMWYGKKGLRKPISVSPQQRLSGEAANGDIASVQYARDYNPIYLGSVRVDGRDCHRLKLVAHGHQVTYEAIEYAIDKATLLGVKADFMTATGTVFKTAYFDYGNTVAHQDGDIPFVSRMKIVNASFPERYSEIDYTDVTPAEHPQSLFRIDNLLTP